MRTRINNASKTPNETSKAISAFRDHQDLELSLNALSLRRGSQSSALQFMAFVMLLSQYYMRRFKNALSAPAHA